MFCYKNVHRWRQLGWSHAMLIRLKWSHVAWELFLCSVDRQCRYANIYTAELA